jgi:hypothetical protein
LKIYEEAKHLAYDVERKEHDLNFFKAKTNEEQEGDFKLIKAPRNRSKKLAKNLRVIMNCAKLKMTDCKLFG